MAGIEVQSTITAALSSKTLRRSFHLAREPAGDLRNDCNESPGQHHHVQRPRLTFQAGKPQVQKPNKSQGKHRIEEKNSLCSATTLKINTKLKTSTTTGSTFRPGDSSVYRRSMVLLEPPAPAARVLLGRALAIFSFWSAAARRRMAVRAPPGGGGEDGRAEAPLAEATAGPAAAEGELARGEDCEFNLVVSLGNGL